MFISFVLKISIIISPTTTGFSLGCLQMGRQVQGDKALMGGFMRGDIHVDLMGGPNIDRLYHKLKVLLLLKWI